MKNTDDREFEQFESNHDFARMISLLRKERRLSQKQVAGDLDISQALLSHYEKGIRECSLTFLVKLADYYQVSCDYLLGRANDPEGKTINVEDIPDNADMSDDSMPGNDVISYNRKIINNSINLLLSLSQRSNSVTLTKCVCSYLMLSTYKLFRIVYNANPKNDQKLFRIPKVLANDSADSIISVSEAFIKASSSGIPTENNDCVKDFETLYITTSTLLKDYPNYASSLMYLIEISEKSIKEKSIKNL
jgi:transcriptional regulator with XRE-family HTH domain